MVAGMKKFSIGMCLAALVAGSAAAAPVNQFEAKALGMNIATAAARAERSTGSQGIPSAVRVAVQGQIIAAGADPVVVLTALDQLSRACRDGRFPDTSWTCPATGEAYMAIAGIRGIVLAQVEQTDPAALDTPGSAPFGSVPATSAAGGRGSAFGSVPSTSSGGSNYRSL
jgi:hypothetical protein